MSKIKYFFAISEYSATGEGLTVCILITRAYPHMDDYEILPKTTRNEDGSYEYHQGVLKVNDEDRVIREFIEAHGAFYAMGVKVISEDEFMKKHSHLLPDFVKRMLTENAGNLNYKSAFHVNFS